MAVRTEEYFPRRPLFSAQTFSDCTDYNWEPFISAFQVCGTMCTFSLKISSSCLVRPPLFRVVYIISCLPTDTTRLLSLSNPRDSKGLAVDLFISFPVYKDLICQREVTVWLEFHFKMLLPSFFGENKFLKKSRSLMSPSEFSHQCCSLSQIYFIFRVPFHVSCRLAHV